MKTTKITAYNKFHGTEIETRISTAYAEDSDPMIALQIAAGQDRDTYAIRTLRRIEKALCPHGQHGCSCTCSIEIV